jgi:hypothetical protein
MTAVNTRYNLKEWRLFMDSSTYCLKALFLHEGNILPLVPLVHKKKTLKHEGNSQVHYLQDISVAHLQWFEGNCHLMDLQKGYTKFCNVLCIWDSYAKSVHYRKNNWPLRKSQTPGTENIAYQRLVDPCSVASTSVY